MKLCQTDQVAGQMVRPRNNNSDKSALLRAKQPPTRARLFLNYVGFHSMVMKRAFGLNIIIYSAAFGKNICVGCSVFTGTGRPHRRPRAERAGEHFE